MKLNHTISAVTTAIAMVVAGNAFAAEDASPTAQGEPPEIAPAPIPETSGMGQPIYTPVPGSTPDIAPVEVPHRWEPASSFGMAIMAGGGVTDFTQSNARDNTSTGGSWDVRFAVGTRRWVGFEGSYIGGANSVHNLGLANNQNTTLVRNGIEGSIRINAPLYAKDTLLEPYVAAGVGWNGYRVANVNNVSASISATSDNTVSVPLAIGFATGYKGFVADLRYTIRPTYQQTIFTDEGSSGLTNWDFGGMLGYEF